MHLYLEGGSASFRALPVSHATSPVDSLPQLLSQAILQEKKASPLGSCKRRSHAQASQPRIVSAKGPFARSPASSSPRQLHKGGGAVQHPAFSAAALCVLGHLAYHRQTPGAAHAASRWSAKSTQQSCSLCSQSESAALRQKRKFRGKPHFSEIEEKYFE